MKAETLAGWMSLPELAAIREIALRQRPKTVLEIGSWAGRSAVCWAETLPESTIYCVDPWPDDGHHYLSGPPRRVEPIFFQFLHNTVGFPNIRPLRCYSRDLLHWDAPPIDLVFIDGDHRMSGVFTDLIVAQRLGAKVVCGHDYNNCDEPMVTPVVDRWAKAKRLDVVSYPGTCIFELKRRKDDADKDDQGTSRSVPGSQLRRVRRQGAA